LGLEKVLFMENNRVIGQKYSRSTRENVTFNLIFSYNGIN
jgi:hypothetical protein